MKFTVLMSIYKNEKGEFLDRALSSIWDEQILKPDEIVLVEDGPLTDDLDKVIVQWQAKLKDQFKTVSIKNNVGLGEALNIGLKHCSYETVARMDTDDIASPDRFKLQLDFLNQHPDVSLVGSWVAEFATAESRITGYRKVPETHDEIVTFAKIRNPFNHPAVMFKKSMVFRAGGYKEMLWFEDYYLWVRMIMNNAKVYNIQKALVKMRAGDGQVARRCGLQYACREIKLQKEFFDIGFISRYRFMANIVIRFIVRILPKAYIGIIYRRLRHKSEQ